MQPYGRIKRHEGSADPAATGQRGDGEAGERRLPFLRDLPPRPGRVENDHSHHRPALYSD